jgi:predicted ArsR family transcriptional regulator
MPPALQIQARALGDPTRHRIFRHIVDADRPVGVAELTELLGLNHNAIRQHLAKLVEAGLLIEQTAAPSGRGRPRLLYTVDPATDARWGPTGPYERLAVLLAEVVRTGDDAQEVGRRAGRQRSRPAGSAVDADPVAELRDEMDRQGFDPVAVPEAGGVTLVLGSCPFASAVLADRDTVCRLHLGLAQGAAETIGGIEVEGLEPRDPRQAQCRLRCRLTEPGA